MLNKVMLMGRLTKDPELRYTQNSIAVCTFSIAVDRNFQKDREQKQTDFFNIVAWRHTAEFISKYFTKGRMIVISGSLQARTWEKDGVKHYATEVVVDEAYFGDNKRDNEGGGYTPSSYSVPAPSGNEDNEFVPIDTDDDLPF